MAIRDMVARNSKYTETLDFIPTTPYATRVFYEMVVPQLKHEARNTIGWDPACGQGHMVDVMKEYHGPGKVIGTDIKDYGWDHPILDFAGNDFGPNHHADVILTNPPYGKLLEFMLNGLDRAHNHFGLLTRVQAFEGQTRYHEIYSKIPPTNIAFFSDRIPMKSGEVARKAPKMYFHVWMHWDMGAIRKHGAKAAQRPPMWIPPNAQALLEKDSDYAKR